MLSENDAAIARAELTVAEVSARLAKVADPQRRRAAERHLRLASEALEKYHSSKREVTVGGSGDDLRKSVQAGDDDNALRLIRAVHQRGGTLEGSGERVADLGKRAPAPPSAAIAAARQRAAELRAAKRAGVEVDDRQRQAAEQRAEFLAMRPVPLRPDSFYSGAGAGVGGPVVMHSTPLSPPPSAPDEPHAESAQFTAASAGADRLLGATPEEFAAALADPALWERIQRRNAVEAIRKAHRHGVRVVGPGW